MDHCPRECYSLSALYPLLPSLSISIFPSDFRFFLILFSSMRPKESLSRSRVCSHCSAYRYFFPLPKSLSCSSNHLFRGQFHVGCQRLLYIRGFHFLHPQPSRTITALIVKLNFAETASSR